MARPPPSQGRVHDDPRVTETARHLFRLLRRVLEEGTRSDAERVVEIAFVQLTRPGRPGARLSSQSRLSLKREMQLAAARFVELSDNGALTRFCREVSEAAYRRVPRGSYARPLADAVESSKDLARMAVLTEYSRSHDDRDLVSRAVTRALREGRRHRQRTVRADVEEHDPLRELLDLPSRGAVRLPPHDIRLHMTNALSKKGETSALPSLLRKAARFSEKTLRPALGEELWGLCRPIGFGDPRGRRVLVQVTSAALAQEVSLRQKELLYRLKAVPGFEDVKELRFLVEDKRSLPVVP